MTAATLQIDMDVLDELFSNQKKLDDILLFEDDFLFGSSSNTQHDSSHKEILAVRNDLSSNSEDKMDNLKSRSMISLIVPLIIEIAAIFYGVMYFS